MNKLERELMEARAREKAEAARERARAGEVWRRLQGVGRPASWREDPEIDTWAFCEKLCHESASVADEDVRLAGEMAELALEVASRISGDEALRCQVQEYAWMHAGNVLRARGNLKRAEEAFAKAREFFVGGITGGTAGIGGTSPNRFERGRVQALEAAVARDKGHLSEALEKIDFGLRLMDSKSPSQAALLLEKGRLHRRLGHPEAAIKELSRAIDLASQRSEGAEPSDPRLPVRIRIELGCALCDLDRFDDLEQLSEPYRRAVAGFPIEEARFVCLEGRTAAGLGRVEEAEEAFRKAQDLQAAAVDDLAVLALDLGTLYAREGRAADLRNLTESILRLAGRPGLRREVAATLKLFCRLAREDKLTAERAALFAKDLSRSCGRG